jgi:hypothetical protein
MTFQSLPAGCPHLPWECRPNPNDPAETPGLLVSQFATWTAFAGVATDLPARRAELASQGLVEVGDPHLCQTDPDNESLELWAVLVTPA